MGSNNEFWKLVNEATNPRNINHGYMDTLSSGRYRSKQMMTSLNVGQLERKKQNKSYCMRTLNKDIIYVKSVRARDLYPIGIKEIVDRYNEDILMHNNSWEVQASLLKHNKWEYLTKLISLLEKLQKRLEEENEMRLNYNNVYDEIDELLDNELKLSEDSSFSIKTNSDREMSVPQKRRMINDWFSKSERNITYFVGDDITSVSYEDYVTHFRDKLPPVYRVGMKYSSYKEVIDKLMTRILDYSRSLSGQELLDFKVPDTKSFFSHWSYNSGVEIENLRINLDSAMDMKLRLFQRALEWIPNDKDLMLAIEEINIFNYISLNITPKNFDGRVLEILKGMRTPELSSLVSDWITKLERDEENHTYDTGALSKLISALGGQEGYAPIMHQESNHLSLSTSTRRMQQYYGSPLSESKPKEKEKPKPKDNNPNNLRKAKEDRIMDLEDWGVKYESRAISFRDGYWDTTKEAIRKMEIRLNLRGNLADYPFPIPDKNGKLINLSISRMRTLLERMIEENNTKEGIIQYNREKIEACEYVEDVKLVIFTREPVTNNITSINEATSKNSATLTNAKIAESITDRYKPKPPKRKEVSKQTLINNSYMSLE